MHTEEVAKLKSGTAANAAIFHLTVTQYFMSYYEEFVRIKGRFPGNRKWKEEAIVANDSIRERKDCNMLDLLR